MYTRKIIKDKLLEQLAALEFDNTNTVFSEVKNVYFNAPTSFPACTVTSLDGQIEDVGDEEAGISYNTRLLGFQIDVYDFIENSTNEANAQIRMDRLENIEDIIVDYLQAEIPTLESGLPTVRIYDVTGISSDFGFQNSEGGLAILLSVVFNVKVIVTV